jgi:hypothetical protein
MAQQYFSDMAGITNYACTVPLPDQQGFAVTGGIIVSLK